MNRWKGVFYALFITSASAVAQTAVLQPQEMRLTPNFKMRYQDLQKTGDQTKAEYIITNPHFIWSDAALGPEAILAESEHRGKLHVILDFKGNRISTDSNGLTHCFINMQELQKRSQAAMTASNIPQNVFENIEFNIEGKLLWSISIDFEQAKTPLEQIQAGDFDSRAILALLKSIKAASNQATGLKISSPNLGAMFYEKMALDYKHTSGENPENMTFSFTSSRDPEIILGDKRLTFPQLGAFSRSGEGNISLPAWEKFHDYILSKGQGIFPGAIINFKSASKSSVSEISGNGFLSLQQQGNGHSFEQKFTAHMNFSPNWVQAYQDFTVEPMGDKTTAHISKESDNQEAMFTAGINWFKKPETAKFLAFAPLQTTLEVSSNIKSTSNPYSFDNVKGQASWLSKQNTGLIIAINYENQKFNSQVTIAGGKQVADYAIQMYNAFTDTLPQDNIPKLSPAAREDLLNLLVNYATQSDKAHTELVFDIVQTENGVNIGNKSFFNFISDMMQFREKHLSTKNQQP